MTRLLVYFLGRFSPSGAGKHSRSWIEDRECWTILTLGMEGAAGKALEKLSKWAGDVKG